MSTRLGDRPWTSAEDYTSTTGFKGNGHGHRITSARDRSDARDSAYTNSAAVPASATSGRTTCARVNEVDGIVAFGFFAIVFVLLIFSQKHVQQRTRGNRLQHGSEVSLGNCNTDEIAEQAEEIIGWRTWQLDTVKSELWLRSVVVPVYWQPGEALQARYFPPAAGSPHGPGIYAAKTEAGAVEAMRDWTGAVYGTVALWGTVIEHVRGYRAQYAYPKHLFCKDNETARQLRRRYGCESEVSEHLTSIRSA
jgi:hypothetical protein